MLVWWLGLPLLDSLCWVILKNDHGSEFDAESACDWVRKCSNRVLMMATDILTVT